MSSNALEERRENFFKAHNKKIIVAVTGVDLVILALALCCVVSTSGLGGKKMAALIGTSCEGAIGLGEVVLVFLGVLGKAVFLLSAKKKDKLLQRNERWKRSGTIGLTI